MDTIGMCDPQPSPVTFAQLLTEGQNYKSLESANACTDGLAVPSS